MNASIRLSPLHQMTLELAWLQKIGARFFDRLLALLVRTVMFALNNTAQTALVTLYFNNTAAANIGNAGGLQPSTVAGSFFISLHNANPGNTGAQNTSETGYTNYARVGIARSSAGWTVTGNQPCDAENAAACTFAACGVTGDTLTYFGIGTASSGAGSLIISAALTSSLVVNNGITPSFAIDALIFAAT